MKTLKHIITIFSAIFLMVSCQKELSIESGNSGGLAQGSLQDLGGNCQPITISGQYVVDSTLKDSNFVLITVDITTSGVYRIVTDELNGMSFRDSGFFTTPGVQTVKLRGKGKPLAPGITDFTVEFDSTSCLFSITTTGTVVTPPPPAGAVDYFPTTTASNWSYTLDITADTVLFSVLPTNRTISANVYRIFKVDDGTQSDSLFYRKGSGLYYEYGDIDFLGTFDTVYNDIDYIFLKDNVAVGATWETPEVTAELNGVQGKAKASFTIIGKNIQKTINGIVVDSVINVKRDMLFKPNGATTFTTASTFNAFYANRKGLLLIEGTTPAPLPPIPYKFEAKRYQVY